MSQVEFKGRLLNIEPFTFENSGITVYNIDVGCTETFQRFRFRLDKNAEIPNDSYIDRDFIFNIQLVPGKYGNNIGYIKSLVEVTNYDKNKKAN